MELDPNESLMSENFDVLEKQRLLLLKSWQKEMHSIFKHSFIELQKMLIPRQIFGLKASQVSNSSLVRAAVSSCSPTGSDKTSCKHSSD